MGRIFQDTAGGIGNLMQWRYSDTANIKGANGVEFGRPMLNRGAGFAVSFGPIAKDGGVH